MKRFFTVLMIMGLLLSIMPGIALAAQEQEYQGITVEKAIEIAKGFFPVAKDYDQFDSNFEQNEYADIWMLRWYHEKGDSGYLNVQVNAKTGEIAGFNVYNPADYSGTFSSIPKVSRQAGEKIARDFIKKVAPTKAGKFILKPSSDNYYGGGPVFHNYNFIRTIAGIEYPANTIRVTVNGQTGEVRSFNLNWEEITAEPLTAKLTRQDAEKIFTDKFGFEFKYFQPQPDGKISKPIKTVYEVKNPYQVTIDALTGEIVRDGYYGIYDRDSGVVAQEKSMNQSSLEPWEQEVADELNALISRESALEIATKAINIPNGYKLNSSSLNRDWFYPELRIWSFRWSLEEKDRYGWAGVEIDAKTGKVLSFNYQEPEKDNQSQRTLKIKTKAAAEKIVNDYLKDNYPEVVGNLRAQSDNYDVRPLNAEEENNQPSYYFRYERLVDGVPFSQNYVNATVNSYTGKITDFQIRFLDMEFPFTDNVLEKAQFTADFLAKNQMILVYTKDQDKKLRLVYKLAPVDSYRFDAVTGEMLNYNGEPITDKKAVEINDIQGHWAEGDINTLNQMGFLHYENNIFQPDAPITQAEVIKALVKSTSGYLTDATKGNWYDNYYREAKQAGLILEKEVNPQAAVTREQLAKFIARTMVRDKITRLDIYQVPFKDGGKISQGYQGYVAIVHGLGIIKGDGTNFNPQAKVKKGEACVALVRYLKTEK